MRDRRYLLSITELLEEDVFKSEEGSALRQLVERCLEQLDEQRLKKAKAARSSRKLAESIGAGLLLQLAVREACGLTEQKDVTEGEESIVSLALPRLLASLEQYENTPLPLEYEYKANSKPFLKNYPYYFNLSHSGHYVFCVISQQEVGADIQWKKPEVAERVVQRFFSEEEKKLWQDCTSPEKRTELFYQLWTRKEAYGKLTGEGITAAVGTNMTVYDKKGNSHVSVIAERDLENAVESAVEKTTEKFAEKVTDNLRLWVEDYEIEDYQIAICKWK